MYMAHSHFEIVVPVPEHMTLLKFGPMFYTLVSVVLLYKGNIEERRWIQASHSAQLVGRLFIPRCSFTFVVVLPGLLWCVSQDAKSTDMAHG